MKLEQLFTQEELSLIDSGEYRPGRAVLDAKLDLCAAAEREACAMEADYEAARWAYSPEAREPCEEVAKAIRARRNT